MKIGIVAPLDGRYEYFGVPIHNGCLLALEEAGPDFEIVVKNDEGDPDLTRSCIAELDDEGVVAILGPVESHNAAAGAAEAESRHLPVVTPSATASYLTRRPNPWFFRAISSDKDRTDALARWAMQDLGGRPILVVHEAAPTSDVDHPPLYGESAGRDFIDALNEAEYPFHRLTFERDHVLSRDLRRGAAQLLDDDAVGAATILSPTLNIIRVTQFLHSKRSELPVYIISPGRDQFANSAVDDHIKAVTDTIIEDTDSLELADLRERYQERFPDEPDDPVYQYATFAYDAGRILVDALRTPRVTAVDHADLAPVRTAVRDALRQSPPRTDLLMSTGNFVANNDLMFKPSRRVLERGSWNAVSRDEIRRLGSGPRAPKRLPRSDKAYDAFLSYRHLDPDESFTRALLRKLEDEDLRVAFDRRDFHPALTFLEEMERCVKESNYTVAIVSPRYFESGNTHAEAIMRQILNMDEQRRRLIPLILEPVDDLPLWMFGIVGINFSTEDEDFDPYERLIAALRRAAPGAGPDRS